MHTCSRVGQARHHFATSGSQQVLPHTAWRMAVMASMNYVGLDEMAWFPAAGADSWGLTRWPPVDAASRHYHLPPVDADHTAAPPRARGSRRLCRSSDHCGTGEPGAHDR